MVQTVHLSWRLLHCLLNAISFRQSEDGFARKTAMILSHTRMRSLRASSRRFAATPSVAGSDSPAGRLIPILSLMLPRKQRQALIQCVQTCVIRSVKRRHAKLSRLLQKHEFAFGSDTFSGCCSANVLM